MLLAAKIFIAVLFVVTGGAVFTNWGRRHRVLVAIAGIFAIAASYFLVNDIVSEFDKHLSHSERQVEDVENSVNTAPDCLGTFFSVRSDETICEFYLDEGGSIYFKSNKISNRILVSDLSNGEKYYAGSLIIYPSSRSGRFYYIKACEEYIEDWGSPLCWSQFLFDSEKTVLKPITAGRYGALPFAYWSPDDRLIALFARSDGYDQLNIFDGETGQAWRYPNWSGKINHDLLMKADQKSFRWIGPRQFELDAVICKVDPQYNLEKCDLEKLDSVELTTTSFYLDATFIRKAY
ncbi:hypothetical protein [Pelagibius sp.]|uniref:hypothetical protein n=1 Tax=Pelagibius sp. TaxID=1931238 RepID=UPI002606AD5D|nr:hypothetical protein [Pelagibius sp.]